MKNTDNNRNNAERVANKTKREIPDRHNLQVKRHYHENPLYEFAPNGPPRFFSGHLSGQLPLKR